ncbi:penicillin-binding protein 1C [Dongia deserti]|uniref:penicillin-binding protein 1C n=1 Tax=Dongia deserti TaxID=2268030 RepID=UPI000E65E39E|nr:penicillin-binding protein 1C [Dongia deserti]
MKLRLRSTVIALGLALAAIAGAALIADRMLPPPLERLDSISTVVLDRDGRVLRAYTTAEGAWRLPAELSEVDPKFLRFLLVYEDQRFRSHPGVDALAVGRAAWQALSHRRVVSGASTLTMQLARLMEPSPRTLGAKLAEMGRALQIEARMSKDDILAAYLTFAPYGGNLEGVRAASLAYFGKEPTRLSDAEAALLVALPQAPETVRPDRFPHAAKKARDKVLHLMGARGLVDERALAAALADPVPQARKTFPLSAPHLADRLTRQQPTARVIETTIDDDLQRALLEVVRRYQAHLEPNATIAVLAVENEGRKVRAYIGSSDFFANRRFGQNDMVTAIRSPGSALKPFIYAMAFDELAAHPETMMPDVALRFGDYAPKNFDGHFRGQISAREALQASLNIPAVALLDRVGPLRFVLRLSESGVPLAFPSEAKVPGLPVALGGVGISLEGLVTLYADVADRGSALPLSVDESPSDAPALEPLMSPKSAYYITKILLDTPPPPSFLAAGNRRNAQPIAYKTGTSFGFRDAWAVGYTRDYTIGVWVGRPDGTFSAGRMGRANAAPILFEAFDLLPQGPSALPEKVPADVIAADNASLPANLRTFRVRPGAAPNTIASTKAVQISYPVDGATLELAPREQPLPALTLQANGGALPLRWLVNGLPIESQPYRRQAQWHPDGRGQVRVTVTDRNGNSASSAVWIK